jgi:hypothetical protein
MNIGSAHRAEGLEPLLVKYGVTSPPLSSQKALPSQTIRSLGVRFAEQHVKTLGFLTLWSRRFEWNGNRWQLDEKLHTHELCRAVANECRII